MEENEQSNADRAHADAERVHTASLSDNRVTEHLIESIDNFTDEVILARKELATERDKRRLVTKIVATFLALSLLGGLFNYYLWSEIKEDRREDNLEESRRRIQADRQRCENYNQLAESINKAIATLTGRLVATSSNPERAAEIEAEVLAELAEDFHPREC